MMTGHETPKNFVWEEKKTTEGQRYQTLHGVATLKN